ncbi:hypothetical protein HanXRQr2_Chr09g0363771 [Helianthus annuus]|uniref:Uncharacterized protein n=1 Tax=Helianthus annuus TaxID=4232 RepID=A0A9K3N6R3_HELAN|nr:hypothetical protein HanXRQr2_Chr09g0363771 [Helianthus annuus]KAJ0891214.1 hypothetical protein HanPSC8_Chr09g0350961 [Helianthus annuus]
MKQATSNAFFVSSLSQTPIIFPQISHLPPMQHSCALQLFDKMPYGPNFL